MNKERHEAIKAREVELRRRRKKAEKIATPKDYTQATKAFVQEQFKALSADELPPVLASVLKWRNRQ